MPKFLEGYIHGWFNCKKASEKPSSPCASRSIWTKKFSHQNMSPGEKKLLASECFSPTPKYIPIANIFILSFGLSYLLGMLSTRPRMLNISPWKNSLLFGAHKEGVYLGVYNSSSHPRYLSKSRVIGYNLPNLKFQSK